MDLESLPGGSLVLRGVADLQAGIESVPALLAAIGAPRLRTLGLDVPEWQRTEFPEHALYLELLEEHGNGAHSRYNSLVRLLVSFERALALAGTPLDEPASC